MGIINYESMNTKTLFTEGWQFKKYPYRTQYSESFNDDIYEEVALPHDWQISDTSNLYEDASGWYKKSFRFSPKENKKYILRFEGVYMDSEVYLNGEKIFEWKYGYSTFDVDMTGRLLEGENTLYVGTHCVHPNSRWYSGAGIYRPVYLYELDSTHIVNDGVYITSRELPAEATDGQLHSADLKNPVSDELKQTSAQNLPSYRVHIKAECENASGCTALISIRQRGVVTYDDELNKKGYSSDISHVEPVVLKSVEVENDLIDTEVDIINANVWDIDNPYLYQLEIMLIKADSENIADCDADGNAAGDKDGQVFAANEGMESANEGINAGNNRNESVKDVTASGNDEGNAEKNNEGNAAYNDNSAIIPKVLHRECINFGLKTIEISPDEGIKLNHRTIRLNGVCLHHDLGALGAKVNRDATRRQIKLMQDMGVNSIRTSHNMTSVEFMELCDEMGILVDAEAFDMWHLPKTEHDYGNFFDEWYKKDVKSWIRRDRNHASLLFWSIGNEIYDMFLDEPGVKITKQLRDEVKLHDPENNGIVTFGSNYMAWEGAQHCAEVVKVPGYNYAERLYKEHHEKHPDWVIYGSETSSLVHSRGIYRFPLKQALLADVNEQCSALGNCTTSWGAPSVEYCIRAQIDNPFTLGQYLWTGIDYIGEPTPYDTKNSYFGMADTAGFPKDMYYFYAAAWGRQPVLHIFPYWNFNEGQNIDVRIVSNAASVELFVNEKSQGVKPINVTTGEFLSADYVVPYEKGKITAVAYDENGKEIMRKERHSFSDPAAYKVIVRDAMQREVDITCETAPVSDTPGAENGTKDYLATLSKLHKGMYFAQISTVDANGHVVEDDNERVKVEIEGPASLRGLDNGDSTDYDSYEGDTRRLFSGKLLAMFEVTEDESDVRLMLTDVDGMMQTACDKLKSKNEAAEGENCGRAAENAGRVRRLEIVTEGHDFNSELTKREIKIKSSPMGLSTEELQIEVATLNGVPCGYASIENFRGISELTEEETAEGICASFTLCAKADGDFVLRAYSKCGCKQAKVLTEYDFNVSGVGSLYINPYEKVVGGLNNISIGNVGNGHDNGCASMGDELTYIGFGSVDFGKAGADKLSVALFFNSSDATQIGIWAGNPNKGGRKLGSYEYNVKSEWLKYIPIDIELPEKLTGVEDIYFELTRRLSFGWFKFEKSDDAFSVNNPAKADKIYGDKFKIEENGVYGIGNNVTIEYNEFDFNEAGTSGISIRGITRNDVDVIQIRMTGENTESVEILKFTKQDGGEHTCTCDFTQKVTGKCKVSFVFLPGTDFDFIDYRFNPAEH